MLARSREGFPVSSGSDEGCSGEGGGGARGIITMALSGLISCSWREGGREGWRKREI